MVKIKEEIHKQTLKEDIIVRLIKMLNMGYANVIFIIPTIFVATMLDKKVYSKIHFSKLEKDEEKEIIPLLGEILIILTINGIVAYILRNILQKLPFPFEGVYGFDHMKIMEVRSGAAILVVLMYFATTIVNKIKTLQQKISKKFS
jgi:hypothetical protein